MQSSGHWTDVGKWKDERYPVGLNPLSFRKNSSLPQTVTRLSKSWAERHFNIPHFLAYIPRHHAKFFVFFGAPETYVYRGSQAMNTRFDKAV
jgi:hypothetical protein